MTELIYNVQDIFGSNGRTGCLQQHGCSAYRIPPYQRGYKWGSEEDEPVEILLRDLRQAWKRKAKEYLLQAITVKKVLTGEDGPVLEVIDGQQRLTTLFILIHAMSYQITDAVRPNIAEKRLHYSIRHRSRPLDTMVAEWMEQTGTPTGSFDQLKKNQKVDEEPQQDCYYLRCAALRCLHALSDRSENSGFQSEKEVEDFQNFVLDEVKLMVNAVEVHVSGEEIFGNLNSNRVALTETELIKGLLLTRVARESSAGRLRRYREVLENRIQLGRKWDELNHWANLPEIRSLYFPTFEKDGMRGLLELVALQMPEPFKPERSQGENDKPLFEYFFRQLNFEPVFRLLANTWARLQDWYSDTRIYHLLGYCLMHERSPKRLQFLAQQLSYKTKPEMEKALFARRSSILLAGNTDASGKLDLRGLQYGGNDDTQIKAILLALSVFRDGDDGRFNFHAYQAENWSLEHIFPQTPFGKGAKLTDSQKKAALDILVQNAEQVLTPETAKELAHLRDAEGGPDDEKIVHLLESEPRLHQIGNLCLLNPGDNAAMGCGMFNEKRGVIRGRIARGSFVPRHTYEVFSKMIVGEDDSLDVWSKQDIIAHQAAIEERIAKLLKEEE